MTKILDNLQLPNDLKKLSSKECNQLAAEIRAFLIQSISQTGGHLASNLGVVELTLALYRVFNLPDDKIVWDVGHQSYVHKILSGRIAQFPTLRQFGGMSGFPKTSESDYDCFNTGHSSTSVSAALGMARARDLAGKNNNIIAVFGDGALTGGMIYEALNDTGHKKTKLILILNDNAMSISKNVGAISRYLRNLRTKPGYYKSKKKVEGFLPKVPFLGKFTARNIKRVKRLIRNIILPPTIFDHLGIEYIGPINGHNLSALTKAFETAKSSQKPILLHVLTKKGKGYSPAEHNPQFFHGVSHFNSELGMNDHAAKPDYSAAFGIKLCELARSNPKITAVTAAMPLGTGLAPFEANFKSRFFDVGIAEEHAVTFAAGMAASGYIPVTAVYSSFFQRAYDQILHDVCLQNLHVVFGFDRAGAVGADGETHHGLYDIAYLSHLPNMSILSPSSFSQLGEMLTYAVEIHTSPIALRYPRGGGEFGSSKPFIFGKAQVITAGEQITIISSGRMMNTAQEVCRLLARDGVSAELIELPTLRPYDSSTVLNSVKKTKLVAVIEDHVINGGIGSLTANALAENGCGAKLLKFAFPCLPIVHGTTAELDKLYHLDAQSIVNRIKENFHE